MLAVGRKSGMCTYFCLYTGEGGVGCSNWWDVLTASRQGCLPRVRPGRHGWADYGKGGF